MTQAWISLGAVPPRPSIMSRLPRRYRAEPGDRRGPWRRISARYDMHRQDRRSQPDIAGKTVVLEWNNPGCPFVQKHYEQRQHAEGPGCGGGAGCGVADDQCGRAGQAGPYDRAPTAQKFVAGRRRRSRPPICSIRTGNWSARAYRRRRPTSAHVCRSMASWAASSIQRRDRRQADRATGADIAAARNHVLAALGEVQARASRCRCPNATLWRSVRSSGSRNSAIAQLSPS